MYWPITNEVVVVTIMTPKQIQLLKDIEAMQWKLDSIILNKNKYDKSDKQHYAFEIEEAAVKDYINQLKLQLKGPN